MGALRLPLAVLLGSCVLVYVALHDIYRVENHDDACSLSYAYNYLHHGVSYDISFGNRALGQNGVLLFGKIWARLYGHTLDTVGWTRNAAHWISVMLIVASAGVWFLLVRRLTGSRSAAATFSLLFLLVEPYFAAANQGRPDSLAFLFASIAFLAYLHRRYFVAGLLSIAAFETHPMGLVGVVFMLAHAVSLPRADRVEAFRAATLRLALGMALGAAGYVALHAQELGVLGTILWANLRGSSGANSNFLYWYFFRTKYLRHLPELVIVVASLVYALKQGYHRKDRFPFVLLAFAVGVSLGMRRPIFHYTAYVYVAFLYMIVETFRRAGRLPLVIALFLGLLLPQYGFVWWTNRDHDFEGYLHTVRATVPADDLAVVGSPNHWFAFPDRTYYSLAYVAGFLDLDLDEFYLIETSFGEPGLYPVMEELIEASYVGSIVGRSEIPEGRLEVHRMSKREVP